MAESTENCMKTGDCFALLAITFETCDLLNLDLRNTLLTQRRQDAKCLFENSGDFAPSR